MGKRASLKGLTIFSRQFKDKILENSRKDGIILTLEGLRATRFREIASALGEKGVSEIRFSVNDFTVLADYKARVRLINRSIRIIIRELATHGIRNKQLKCSIVANSAEERNLKAIITIDPAKNATHRAKTKIEIGYNK
jgi:hypothetical protein